MKNLHYLFIVLLFLPMLSCKKKYTLDGSIDNSDFIGKWVLPLGTGHDIYEIKENGKIIHTVATYDNNSPDRDGSTSDKKGKIQIEGDKMLLEYRFLMQENLMHEFFIIQHPTNFDTTITTGENNQDVITSGSYFEMIGIINSENPGYVAGDGYVYYKMQE
ncbi:MAG: hypothetical protein HOB26_06330 [Flavobacteriales bacterium]|nr:hypothetical protein [Flavobacteriales bacterium]MBT6746153.1 hypothetical protein [Flavobacteriales bacterium]